MRSRFLAAALVAATALTSPALAQDGADVTIQGHVYEPTALEPTDARVAALRAPAGFRVAKFAEGLGDIRMLAVAPDGTIYATRREEGDVVMLRDANGDGRADAAPVVVASRPGMHGIAIHQGRMYLATVKEVYVAQIGPDGRLGALQEIIDDLPDAGQHPNRTLAVGPDDMLYITVGSTCNACSEPNPENATVLRSSLDGKSRGIWASGLRNTIGFGWHPRTGELWGMDHGIDWLGDDDQPEELNRIELGKRYGWPYVYADGKFNPQDEPPNLIPHETWDAMSTRPLGFHTAHAAPMQMAFYTGAQFPAEYAGDAFVAMRGSWNRKPPSGYEVARVRFDAQGRATRIEPFLSGFLVEEAGRHRHLARLAGVAVARDGALLVADDGQGVLYRVSYEGNARRSQAADARAPAEWTRRQTVMGMGVTLALRRPETNARGTLRVASPAIPAGGPIPMVHSEYGQGASPPIGWTTVADARSYAILVEDPDAKDPAPTPFVHWVAYNIPANVTSLPEGLAEELRLRKPEGLLQGVASNGFPGWFGPKPPVGDPPHRYHFQVFALDAMLDLKPGAKRDKLLAAMRGHVLAKGELVGAYQQAVEPPS